MSRSIARTLCVDIGGTRTKWALGTNESLTDEAGSLPSPKQYDELVKLLVTLAQEHQADRLAVAVPGPVSNGVWLRGVEPTAITHAPLSHDLRTAGAPNVTLLHDTNAMLRGEAAGTEGVLGLLVLSTGVGVGVASDGRPTGAVDDHRPSERSLGLHLAHTVLHTGGHPCHCGGTGCIASYVGWGAVRRRANCRASSPSEVLALADDGDPQATMIIDGWLEGVARLASILISTVRPRELRLAGGVAADLRSVLDARFESALSLWLAPYLREGVVLSHSSLGSTAGLRGLLHAATRQSGSSETTWG
jgi:predicted NBD/HSP70 family sugar kinase